MNTSYFKRTSAFLACTMASAAALVIAGAAHAEMPPLDMGARLPAELQSPGFVYKGFVYKPSLTLNTQYDDNIYVSNSAEQDDLIFTVIPKVSVQKDYDTLSLNFQAKSEIERFVENTTENKDSYFVTLAGSFRPNSRWLLPFSIKYSDTFRDRGGSVGTVLTVAAPTGIRNFNAETGIVRRFNRLSLGVLGSYASTVLEDGVSSLDAATPVIFSDKDRERVGARVEARYDFLRGPESSSEPEHTLFATLGTARETYKRRNYVDADASFTGLSDNQDSYEGLVGFETKYKGILSGRFGVGFLEQNYEEESLETKKAIDFEADVKYLVTPRLTLNLLATRDVEQDNDVQQGVLKTSYTINPEYEIYHNLYLGAQFGYRTSDLGDESRKDDDTLTGMALRYYISKNLESTLSVVHTNRDSTTDTSEYDRTVFLLGITGKL